MLVVLAGFILVLANLSNWNWLRAPISRYVADKTGRELVIGGDLVVHLGWPKTQIRTENLTFSNPAWARAPNMVAVKNMVLNLDMSPLLKRAIVFSEVRLDATDISLEKSMDGRKNWLLDQNQQDEKSQIQINSLAIHEGRINYRDPLQKTDLGAELTTLVQSQDPASALIFKAHGRYRGQALSAQGKGGSILALRDVVTPYPVKISASIGPTHLRVDGRITNLFQFSALNVLIDVRGGSLAQLYSLLGIVLPETPPYHTSGRLIRQAKMWRYEKFSGQIGKSDIAGTLNVVTRNNRTSLTGALNSKQLYFADLGPLVGAKQVPVTAANGQRNGRVLPDIPFRTERWNKMDADVTLKAESIVRNEALPINNLTTHLLLDDSILTLAPLTFGVAGGTLTGSVKLNGRTSPIQARMDLKARKIRIAQLFPTFDRAKTSIGLVNGDIDLEGSGNTIASMLDSANGKFAMVVNGGEISKLMMEAVGLHLLEMLQLTLAGDKNIQIRCGIADFEVKSGVLRPNVLMLDTDITHLSASGVIDLGAESLDLTLIQKSKKLSLISLRPPIHIRGNFAKPDVSMDKGKLVTRGLGAAALAIVNPFLALLPLIEPGKDRDSDCAQLIQETRTSSKNSARPNY